MAKIAALTLANICLDVQIGICMCLHPSDILALRKTCKAFYRSTRQRVVWVDALHRVCYENTLFLPSFPISDMSDLELEKAAMGPRRWIELCVAYEKRHLNDPGAILRPQSSRIINYSFATEVRYGRTQFFIVPGGRYLVCNSADGISVLDLGYTSSSDCKLIASVGVDGGTYGGYANFKIRATPDGMGLNIFLCGKNYCSVYEIYPQSETPHITRIAHLDRDPSQKPEAHLLPGRVIWYGNNEEKNKTIFRVWDYRLNHSTSFTIDVVEEFEEDLVVMATKTTVIVLYKDIILIWAIPPLSPQPPNFFENNHTHLPPLISIPLPDDIEPDSDLVRWITISPWYFGSSQPLYCDMLCRDYILHRFEIILKPDLSTASLHIINAYELTPHDFGNVMFPEYTICEDALVCCFLKPPDDNDDDSDQLETGIYTGLTTAHFANDISHDGPAANMLLPDIGNMYDLFLCPASGRCVRVDAGDSVTVLDFF